LGHASASDRPHRAPSGARLHALCDRVLRPRHARAGEALRRARHAGVPRVSRVAIREARREDAAAIVVLVRALAEFEHLPGPDDADTARFVEHGFGPRPHFETLVAELDGAVVAYAIFLTTYSTFRMRPTLFLEDVFVRPDA